MNEQIGKLAEQARIKDHWSIDEGRYLTNYLDEKKFAELIVREYENEIWNCVMVESAGSDDKFLIRGIVRSALHDAKQHFGVEE